MLKTLTPDGGRAAPTRVLARAVLMRNVMEAKMALYSANHAQEDCGGSALCIARWNTVT